MDDIIKRLENLEKDFREVKSEIKGLSSKSDLKVLEDTLNKDRSIETLKQTADLKQTILDSISKIPNEDRVKLIISEEIKSQKIASETFVENQVIKSQNLSPALVNLVLDASLFNNTINKVIFYIHRVA